LKLVYLNLVIKEMQYGIVGFSGVHGWGKENEKVGYSGLEKGLA
jgi:hypothetical protein